MKGVLKRRCSFLLVLSLASLLALLALLPTQGQVNTQTASFEVPPRYDYYFWLDLSSGDTITFTFYVSSWRRADDISFTLVSSAKSVLLDAGRVNQYTGNYTAAFRGRYYLRFDNSYSIFTTKRVTLSYSVVPPTLRIETYEWGGNTMNGSLRNYGASPIDTKNAIVTLNDIAIRDLGGSCGQTPLNPSGNCTFSITVPNETWALGKPYVLKLVTPNGSFFFPVVAGGNSESVIETEPTLITFQTVKTETTLAVQSENQGILFSQDFFLKNTFAMIGALAGGILLLGAILGLFTISIASRGTGKGLYGEDENRRGDSRRKVPLLMIITLGAFGLLTISVLTPRLGFNFGLLYSRIPLLLTGALALILMASILGFTWVVTSILRGRRASLRNVEVERGGVVLQEMPQTSETQPEPVKTKKCRYCGAGMPRDGKICRKCGMPAIYLGADP